MSESAPLVPKGLSTTKRVKSYSSTFNVLAKRRIRAKSRLVQPYTGSSVSAVDTQTRVAAGAVAADGDVSNALPAPSLTTLIQSDNDAQDVEVWSSSPISITSAKPPLSSPPPSPSARSKFDLTRYISLTLENSGSVARDHLASERTFLAYLRTSLALASSGVALVQLFTVASASTETFIPGRHRLHTYIRPLGAMTIAMGLIVLVTGTIRYFSVQNALTKGYFPAARFIAGIIAMLLITLITLTFGILLAGKLEPKGI